MKAKIEVNNNNELKEIMFDTDAEELFLNGVKKDIDVDDFAIRFLLIVSSWDEKMVDEEILDGDSYHIIIKEDQLKKEYFIQNESPESFNDFIDLIGEIK